MSYQKNPLPLGTPVMIVDKVGQAMALKGIAYTPPSVLTPILLAVVGITILAGSLLVYNRMKRAP